MDKKIIISFVVAIVAVIGLYLIFGGRQAGPVTEIESDKTMTEQGVVPAGKTGTVKGTAGTLLIEIKGYSFSTEEVRVPVGTKIVWKNTDPVPHTVTSYSGLFDKTVLTGQTFEYVFNKAGDYSYYCSIHPNMSGRIIVK